MSTSNPTQRTWTMEDLFSRPGARGLAKADARFNRNASARAALTDLNCAVRDLELEASELDTGHGNDAA